MRRIQETKNRQITTYVYGSMTSGTSSESRRTPSPFCCPGCPPIWKNHMWSSRWIRCMGSSLCDIVYTSVPAYFKFRVQGEGIMSSIYRGLVAIFDPISKSDILSSFADCVPRPRQPNFYMYRVIGLNSQQSLCLSLSLSVCLYVCMSVPVRMYVCLSVCLSVCLVSK